MHQPELYVENNSLQIAGNFIYLKKYLNNVKWKKENISVLDIGCGDGFSTLNVLRPMIPRKCVDIFGCDKSVNMINYAKKRNTGIEEKFAVLDIGRKEIPKGWEVKFDHVFSFFCLHFADLRVAFQNIFDMLRQDGDLLVWYVYKSDHSMALLNLSKHPRWKRYFSNETRKSFEKIVDKEKTPEDTGNMLAEIGFRNYSYNFETMNHTFENMNNFCRFLESIDLISHNFNEKEKSDYFNDYVDELKKSEEFKFIPTQNGDEIVYMEFQIIVIYASKV